MAMGTPTRKADSVTASRIGSAPQASELDDLTSKNEFYWNSNEKFRPCQGNLTALIFLP